MPKPPSIYITDVTNISPLMQLLEQTAKQQYEIKAFADNQVKVQPKTSESYRTIIKALAENRTEFRIYKLKEGRNYRVMLKNMHYSIALFNTPETMQKYIFCSRDLHLVVQPRDIEHINYMKQVFNNPYPNMNYNCSTSKEIEKIVKSFKSKNSYGYDEISPRVLKVYSPFISSPINYIRNKIRGIPGEVET
jgi:hypothetical protein